MFVKSSMMPVVLCRPASCPQMMALQPGPCAAWSSRYAITCSMSWQGICDVPKRIALAQVAVAERKAITVMDGDGEE